jgi:hypothetical protein
LKIINEVWDTALSNPREVCARVADRYNAVRRQVVVQVGGLFLARIHAMISKWRQLSAKLDYK